MRYSKWIVTGTLTAGAVTGLLLPTIHPLTVQPAQYAVYTVSQPRCSAAEAGDMTTFILPKHEGSFRAVCGQVTDGYVWQALPDPADVKPVCGPGSTAETVYCPNVSDWREW